VCISAQLQSISSVPLPDIVSYLAPKVRFTGPGELSMYAKDLYSIEEARELLGGISRNSIYHLLRDGKLASVPIGRRRFISAAAIEAFILATTTTEAPEPGHSRFPRRRVVQMRLGLKAPVIARSRRHLPEN